MSQWDFLEARLSERKAQNLYRHRLELQSPQGCHIKVDGRQYTAFCSNDYLNLANDSRVVRAATEAMDEFGLGGGASHLVIGHHQLHEKLEQALAEFTGRERAICFSSGYMANLGVISALADRHTIILQDKLNHASLLDAGKLSGAKMQRYSHCDMEALNRRLEANQGQKTLVVTDGVFSMDGDIAPLDEIASLCEQFDALLMVDDAHGLGVLDGQKDDLQAEDKGLKQGDLKIAYQSETQGEQSPEEPGALGAGCVERFELNQAKLPVLMGTLGKAFGTAGAFVAGSETLIEYLIQFSRTYIYTTSLPPAIAAATIESLRIIKTEAWRRAHLQSLISRFRHHAAELGLNLMPSTTPIQPILVGDSEQAVTISQKLKQAGILVPAIRPPTVPDGTARLRITFSAGHSEADLDKLLNALEQAKQ